MVNTKSNYQTSRKQTFLNNIQNKTKQNKTKKKHQNNVLHAQCHNLEQSTHTMPQSRTNRINEIEHCTILRRKKICFALATCIPANHKSFALILIYYVFPPYVMKLLSL